MKKVVCSILVIILLCAFTTGCYAKNVTVMKQEDLGPASDISIFIVVESSSMGWRVVYDRETKVMYAISNGGYNAGNFTLLVNADGSPKLWKE